MNNFNKINDELQDKIYKIEIEKAKEISDLVLKNEDLDLKAMNIANKMKELENLYKIKLDNLDKCNRILQDNLDKMEITKEMELSNMIIKKQDAENI